MESYAPAQIDELAADGVAELQAEGPRSPTKKLDLSDPRQINKEVVIALARKVSPDRIADKINELLDMQRMTKAGPVPDVRAMEAGIKLYLSYAVGLPTQRSEILTVAVDADSATGMEDRLRHSPALRSMFRKMLERVENPE